MELRHLRYFITVAQEQSFTRAAEKLFTAQPSLSQQIKDLEQEVGVNLFERSSRKIQLTDEGKAFLIYAEKLWKMPNWPLRQHDRWPSRKITRFILVSECCRTKSHATYFGQAEKDHARFKIHLHSLFCLEQLQRLKMPN